jgi:hypothetical protein
VKSNQSDPAWADVDASIDRVEGKIKRALTSEVSDAVLVSSEQMRAMDDGDEAGRRALRVASAEGNRRRIYYRNHQSTGSAEWVDAQGEVFKRTGQFPLTVRAKREAADGTVVDAEVPVRLLSGEELDRWIAARETHLAGEALNLDVFRELRRRWVRDFPDAETLGEMCAMAGLDLSDLQFRKEA